jgi:hypothetical protein
VYIFTAFKLITFYMKKILTLFLVFLIICGKSQTFKAGAAFRIITPEKLLPISGGMGTPVIPETRNGDLFARAIVLENGKTRVAIVSVDNLGWPAYLGDRSRKLIKGIPPECILIGATHTHSAPDAYGFVDEKGNSAADLKYLDWCVNQISDAVNDAVKNLEPAKLKTAVDKANGKIAYNYYAEKLYDPRCGVIQAVGTSGKNRDKAIFTLVNYAIHPEILGTGRKTLSPDLCGPLYDKIEKMGGGMAIFMNGAQGGMVTADTRLPGGGEANNWEECIRIGELLANEALRIINSVSITENPRLQCTNAEIPFPVDNPVMQQVFKHSPLASISPKSDFTSITTRINLLNIGNARILTIPGEALPNIGYYLKRKMNTGQPFLFGLTNDAFGYIITKEDFNSFDRYNYITRTSLGERTCDIYVQEAIKLLDLHP